ncbi:MAG: hypothetical protein Q4Q56_04375, partial [Coriobacteriia bacterium]|nr:hypothetical protein [Coriobacteriia bacterium]
HPAVNRRVVGSNPTRGAILKLLEPVEGKGSLDGFFLYFNLNSSPQRGESVASWEDRGGFSYAVIDGELPEEAYE